MASNRIGRINEEIQRELQACFEGPPVQSTMISITRVEITDLRYAKVYVSFLDKARGETLLKGSARRRLPRRELGALCSSATRRSSSGRRTTHHPGAHMLDLLNSLHIAKDDEHESSDHS